ncbi:hypothetical protein [Streptomyces macrosporus]|uniref:Uncharacterized protein n=1 Tax=Streptomyces macrosporus TaxID=44032 RepID=A0ABP5XMG4_9ACTN
MTITIRITLPDLTPSPDTKRLLHKIVPLAAPALLTAIDTSGISLPARLVLHTMLNAAHDAVRTGPRHDCRPEACS